MTFNTLINNKYLIKNLKKRYEKNFTNSNYNCNNNMRY
jgi:hypothetical protein